MSTWRDSVRRVAGAPARPFVRYFNRRFADVHEHLDNESVVMNAQLEEALETTRALQERVTTDLEVLSELTLSMERVARRLDERMSTLELELDRLREHSTKT